MQPAAATWYNLLRRVQSSAHSSPVSALAPATDCGAHSCCWGPLAVQWLRVLTLNSVGTKDTGDQWYSDKKGSKWQKVLSGGQ
jgi:hypothetical protein